MRFPILLLLSTALAAGEAEGPASLGARLQHEAQAYAEVQSAGLSGTYRITALQPPKLPRLPQGEVRFEPSHLSKREPVGMFFAVFRTYVDGRPYGSVRVDLEGKWTGKLLRTRTALARKSVPTEDQLESFDFEGTPPPGALTELPEELRLKVALGAGHVMTRADLEPIPLVNTGDSVRLTLSHGDLSITTEAMARSHGAKGDKVRVELLHGKRQIMAVVKGPGEAWVDWSGSRK
jgi:flagella basal body P-ring formation protein FlgA